MAEANTQCALHRPAPPRADMKAPSTLCLGRPLPWVRGSSETRLLLRQRGISMPASPWGRTGVQPSQRKLREPRAHAQGLTTTQTSHRQHSGHFPRPPQQTQVASQQVKSPYSLTQACLNGQVTATGQGLDEAMGKNYVWAKGTRASGPGQPSSPHGRPGQRYWLSGGAACLAGATAALLLGRPVSAAAKAVQLSRKVSGTEVYFQEVTVGPRPHSPTLHTPTGTH